MEVLNPFLDLNETKEQYQIFLKCFLSGTDITYFDAKLGKRLQKRIFRVHAQIFKYYIAEGRSFPFITILHRRGGCYLGFPKFV